MKKFCRIACKETIWIVPMVSNPTNQTKPTGKSSKKWNPPKFLWNFFEPKSPFILSLPLVATNTSEPLGRCVPPFLFLVVIVCISHKLCLFLEDQVVDHGILWTISKHLRKLGGFFGLFFMKSIWEKYYCHYWPGVKCIINVLARPRVKAIPFLRSFINLFSLVNSRTKLMDWKDVHFSINDDCRLVKPNLEFSKMWFSYTKRPN